jgi:hypothetical protein
MSAAGDSERLLIAARRALLDALEALEEHRDALVLIGAQAIYLHTGAADVALAEATKDSDIVIDPRVLEDEPLLDEAMRRAEFHPDLEQPRHGSWLSPDGIPVDLMVPERLAGPGSKKTRGARIPPHDERATRRTPGLEAAVVDHAPMRIDPLDALDGRHVVMNVAGPAALLVAKLHKLGDRQATPTRLVDKDAHDVYRLLVAVDTATLAARLHELRTDALAGEAIERAIELLNELFGQGPEATGAAMAGRAEELVGDPLTVSASVAALAGDLLEALET